MSHRHSTQREGWIQTRYANVGGKRKKENSERPRQRLHDTMSSVTCPPLLFGLDICISKLISRLDGVEQPFPTLHSVSTCSQFKAHRSLEDSPQTLRSFATNIRFIKKRCVGAEDFIVLITKRHAPPLPYLLSYYGSGVAWGGVDAHVQSTVFFVCC